MSKEEHEVEPTSARSAMGGWISGQAQAGQWPGELLGLPEQGSGSMGRLGRRIGGLWVDWLLSLAVSAGFFDADPMMTLAVFALQNVLLVGTIGHTIGHRIFGLHVIRLWDGGSTGIIKGFVRTVLLCLVIPAVVWDSDGRGLHDRAAGSVIVRI